MKAILLAAGLGTRLRPITDTVPKCLVPINGRPLLDFWLEMLFSQGVEQVLVNTHHLHEAVVEFVNRSRWRDRVVLVHETDLLGTGGTVLQNRDFVAGESFLVAHADNLTCFDFVAFRDHHENRRAGIEITMMSFTTDSPKTCGILELDSQGIVRRIHEKAENPPGNTANGAVYLFSQKVIDFMVGLGKPVIDLSTEVLPAFLGRIQAYQRGLYLLDMGSPENLGRAERDLEVYRRVFGQN